VHHCLCQFDSSFSWEVRGTFSLFRLRWKKSIGRSCEKKPMLYICLRRFVVKEGKLWRTKNSFLKIEFWFWDEKKFTANFPGRKRDSRQVFAFHRSLFFVIFIFTVTLDIHIQQVTVTSIVPRNSFAISLIHYSTMSLSRKQLLVSIMLGIPVATFAAFDFFNIEIDLCDNSAAGSVVPELGRCDLSRFPTCDDKDEICYNRKPSRDHFDPITHQPVYFIQYDRVLCYPNNWGGCSSCTPGRYCLSEERCIWEEWNYPCAQWF